IADYSSIGPRIGENETSIADLKPDIVAPGTNIYAPQHNTANVYVSMSGTSMATPIVSGIVSMMLEANHFLSTDQVKDILRQAAERRGDPYDETLDPVYNEQYGWGMVDAYAAVSMAENTTEPDLSLTVLDVGKTNVSLAWGEYGGTGFERYNISISKEDDGSDETIIEMEEKDNTSITMESLEPDTTYRVTLEMVTWWGSLTSSLTFVTNQSWTGENMPPVALIEDISPDDVTIGDEVYFFGSGIDPDGTVEAYSWRSSIDSHLSTEKEFTTSDLSAGSHTIFFKVQDDRGEWSEEDEGQLTVRTPDGEVPEDEPPSIVITSPEDGEEVGISG
ncbi:MAG: S8 family serine peptidase, partial [Thermoplasmata archaeon]|nr:S8 family serine peptidase [Thermoplasmata archaeon]